MAEEKKEFKFFFKGSDTVLRRMTDVSKNETLNNIRPKVKKMTNEHQFINKQNEPIDPDAEEDYTIEDISIDDNGIYKIYILDLSQQTKTNQLNVANKLNNGQIPEINQKIKQDIETKEKSEKINENKKEKDEIKDLRESKSKNEIQEIQENLSQIKIKESDKTINTINNNQNNLKNGQSEKIQKNQINDSNFEGKMNNAQQIYREKMKNRLTSNYKYYVFCFIIDKKYDHKENPLDIYFTIKNERNRTGGESAQQFPKDFPDFQSKGIFGSSKIERKLYLCILSIPKDINEITIVISAYKEYKIEKKFTDFSSLIIDLNPLKDIGDLKGKEFFIPENDKEKEILLNNFVEIVKGEVKDINDKITFLKTYLMDTKVFIVKPLMHIFYLVNIFDDNFLDANFNIILNSLDQFKMEQFTMNNQVIKTKILKLYDCVKNTQNLEEIHLEIWPFLISFLSKLNLEQKVLDILNLIKKAKNLKNIIARLFERIKKAINIFKELKKYFKYIIKYNLNELDFVKNNINKYYEYLEIIEFNKDEIKNESKIIEIFPKNISQNIDDKEKESLIHKIITIIKDIENNIVFDSHTFVQIFPDYINLLNLEEQEILKNFLTNNCDQYSKQIKIDIIINNIQNCHDNKELFKVLLDSTLDFKLYQICMTNINFESLSEDELKSLKKIVENGKFNYQDNEALYLIFFKKVKSLEDFNKIWKIFGVFEFNFEYYVRQHKEKFWEIYDKEKINIEAKGQWKTFLDMFIFLKKNKQFQNFEFEFLEKINAMEKQENIIDIYEYILTDRTILNEHDKNIIISFYKKHPFEKYKFPYELKQTYCFLNEYFKDKRIEKNYFYENSDEVKSIFRIFNYLNIHEDFKNQKFYQNSIESFEKFSDSIDNYEINLSELKSLKELIKNPDFDEKIKYFFGLKEKDKKKFIEKIESTYDFISKQKNKLNECKNYLDKFRSIENLKIKNKIISLLKDDPDKPKHIKKFILIKKDKNFLEKIEKIFEKSQKYNKIKLLKLSSIFIKELENKVDKEVEEMTYLEIRINDMRKILTKISMKDIDKNLFNQFLSLFENENQLIEEIINLKKFFKMEKEDTSTIEKFLVCKFKCQKFIKTLQSYTEIIALFDLIPTKFSEKIKELMGKMIELDTLNDNLEENSLEEIIGKIEEFIKLFETIEPNLNLKLIPMDIISFVVDKFQENSLLNFMFDLTINDLRDISNSLAGSSLDINDINDYILIRAIITELKEKSGINDENEEDEEINNNIKLQKKITDIVFFKFIPSIIKEKLNDKTLEEFEKVLERCSQNQPKLLLLFENMKGFESSKEDIRKIIKDSIFEIYEKKEFYKNNSLLFESRYNCRCIFSERTEEKYLKELITLQQLASLSQNKEKEEENKILNLFIDLMENIKEILSVIEKIIYKGFPEEFYYRIKINDGIASCENMIIESKQNKKISDEKALLKKLLKEINKSQMNAYKEKKFLKFFYGKQLTLINNYLKKKIGKRNNKNEVSNLIYYIIGNKFENDVDYFYKSFATAPIQFNFDENKNDKYFNLENNDIIFNNDNGGRPNTRHDSSRINLTGEYEISTKPFDDTISEIPMMNISNPNEKSKKNKITKNSILLPKKPYNFPLLKQGTEQELQSIMEAMYNNVEKYLEEIMEENKITEESIFENSIIKNEKYEDQKGFYIFNSGENIYKYILKFYHCLVGNDPPNFILLLCNDETSLEEILAFLYLAIFCPYHSLFIVAKPDRLKIDIIYEVQSILEKMKENEQNIKSLILFLFNDIGKSEIGKELLRICKSADEPNKDLRASNNKNKIIISNFENKDYYKNIQIIISTMAGFGKSYYIQKKCREENLMYIPFPIGGEIKRQTIMRRLKELNLKKKNCKYGLHFDFSDTKQSELFEDFIFSFLIQKFYSNNENIFCYEDNVQIFIEIQNGFLNLIEKFKLFKEFYIHKIEKLPELELQEDEKDFKDFEDMKYDKENNINSLFDIQLKNEKLNHKYLYQSDIQLVCNYLKNSGNISKKNIFFYNLNEKIKGYNIYVDSKYLKQEECRQLLDKYNKKKFKNYHQFYTYIKVLADQLRKFSINYYLMVENLFSNKLSGNIRNDIVKAFLDLTDFFAAGAFDGIVFEQNMLTDNKQNNYYNEKEEIENAIEKLSIEKTNINFDELNDKGFIFINNDGQSLTIITCAKKDTKIYQKLDKLYNSGLKFGDEKDKHLNIPDFSKMTKNEEYLEIIKRIVDSKEDIQTIKKKLGAYVFNTDNFFKMVQILLRFRAGIPVLIMGETGCGKTSLINAIAKINNYKMITFNIHAGVNDNEIVQFMIKNNLLENELGYDEFEDDIENLFNLDNNGDSTSISLTDFSNKNIINEMENKETDKKINNETLIVFFDEFNTCNSTGLLTEIMCNRMCQGVKVKKNVIFAGACNPYRKIIKSNKFNNNDLYESTALIKEGSPISKQNLVYSVNPLTFTQLYYIFNFGSLNEENERKYITSIVNSEIDEYVQDKGMLEEIKNIMINSFMTAQSFIKLINGKESVSMRETRKFMTIYEFIIKDFERKCQLSHEFSKKQEKEKKDEPKEIDYHFYLDKDEFFGQRYSIATAIYICFYIRLSSQKNEFQLKMNKVIGLEFLSYPKQLQDELMSNIKLEKGIAPNESLRLNLFICFIGILTRIAVFLVGPPGCSKTLCFNLLKKEMKGYHSKSKFWREYPQLVVTSYQGSLTSTSKGIIDTFKDGEKKLKDYLEKNKKTKQDNKDNINEVSEIDNEANAFNESNKKIRSTNEEKEKKKDKGIIVCIFIDEIGLCETSPANPLKALHTKLELDYNNQNIDEKLAFVAISNWKLDAAKMNRGIYLNVLNPISDLNQMKETAFQISNVYDKTFSILNKELLENLTKVVFNYNLHLKNIKDKQFFFHGTRDFYNLIKTVTKKILYKDFEEKSELKSALFSIECNYNGITRNGVNSAEFIKKQFKNIYPDASDIDNFGIVKCIKNNLNDDDTRYLLLIMKSNLGQYLVLNILKDIREMNKIIYYLGSLFEDDIFNEAYSAKTINKIRFYLENDIILVLKNLSTTYASLYDLFNQRFTYIKNQKYTEISLGEVSNSSYVNDNLKIIVLIKEEMVKEQDPPFLNRFEKYSISFDHILDDKSKKIAKNIMEYKKIFFRSKRKKIKFNFENELINYYDEEIKSLISEYILKSVYKKEINEGDIFDKIFEKISKTFSQELIAYLNHYRKTSNPKEVNKINKFYSKAIHSNLETYLNKANKTINVIYTFTPTVRSTKFYFEVKTEGFGVINSENIKNIYINLIRTEKQLEIELTEFYDSDNRLLIINFEETDSQNLEFVLMFLERFEKDKALNQEEKKIVILLIHLKRKKEPYNLEIFVPNLTDIEQTFIDNLYGQDILISDLMKQSIRELYQNKKLVDTHELFINELFCCFQKIEYLFQDNTIEQNDYIKTIINKILNDETLIKRIIEKIINEIEKGQKIQEEEEEEENENEIENEKMKDKLNIFDYIFENNSFDNDVDFITTLCFELRQLFIKNLNKFIINSEKLTILPSIFKELPQSASKIWQNLFDNFDFSKDININLKSNKIKVWTKLNLPSIKSIEFIKKVIESDINQYIEEYLEEEKNIRLYNEPSDIIENEEENEEEDDEEKKKLINDFFIEENNDINDFKFKYVKKELKKFFVPKSQVINYIRKQFEKDKFIQSFEDEEKEELLDLFFKDYYIHIITLLIQKEDIFYYNLLVYLIELRFGKKKIILWIIIQKVFYGFMFIKMN